MMSMGYCTRYNGRIKIFSQDCKLLVEYLLSNSNDESKDWETGFVLCNSSFDGHTLHINEDWKNYNDDIESVLSLIAMFDKSAQGVVEAVGEDGNNLHRLTIFGGRLTKEDGYIEYKDKVNAMIECDEDTLAELRLKIKRMKSLIKCQKCNAQVDIKTFDFTKRGYYDEVKLLSKYDNLCEKCYRVYKKIVLELKEIEKKKAELLKRVV